LIIALIAALTRAGIAARLTAAALTGLCTVAEQIVITITVAVTLNAFIVILITKLTRTRIAARLTFTVIVACFRTIAKQPISAVTVYQTVAWGTGTTAVNQILTLVLNAVVAGRLHTANRPDLYIVDVPPRVLPRTVRRTDRPAHIYRCLPIGYGGNVKLLGDP
jgi:hypothetical protein